MSCSSAWNALPSTPLSLNGSLALLLTVAALSSSSPPHTFPTHSTCHSLQPQAYLPSVSPGPEGKGRVWC